MSVLYLLFSFVFFIPTYFSQYNDGLYEVEANNIHFQTDTFTGTVKRIFKDSTKSYEIFHVGDSHLQMGSFSEGILDEFKQQQISLNEGWILPKGVFKNLVNRNVEVHFSGSIQAESTNDEHPNLPLGITGRSFRLLDEKTKVKITSKKEESIKTVEFLHLNDEHFVFRVRACRIETKKLSERYSITKLIFTDEKEAVSFQIRNRKYEHATFFAMRVNHREKGIHYSNFGVSGLTFRECVLGSEIATQMEALKPDLVIFSLGTNDSYIHGLSRDTLQIRLHFLYGELKKLSPNSEIIFMSAPFTTYKDSPPSSIRLVNEEIKRLCSEKNIAFWDWEKVSGGELLFSEWQSRYLVTNDKLHFSKEGYRLIGKLFADALLKLL